MIDQDDGHRTTANNQPQHADDNRNNKKSKRA